MAITAKTRSRPRIGDVIEVHTSKGLAYVHYTHKHGQYGALLRVLPNFYRERPKNFSEIVDVEPQFMTFFPLGAACSRRIVHIVGNVPVPERAQIFPTFRTGIPNKEGKVESWWLWDGEKGWKIGALKPGMERFPLRGIWNDTLLVQRIEEGWRHEHAI
jgi:hypothetical protein